MKRKYNNRIYSLRLLLKQNKGVASIEFAIIAPILFMLLLTVIELGILMYASSLLDTLTHQAARFGKTGFSYSGLVSREQFITDFIKDNGAPLLDRNSIVIAPVSYVNIQSAGLNGVSAPSYGGGNDTIAYRVSYPWPVMTPFMKIFTPTGFITLTSTTLVKNEGF